MAQRQIPAGKTFQKTLESPPLQSIHKVIDIPVVLQKQAYRPDVSEDAGVSAVTVHRQGGRCPRRASAQELVEKTIEIPRFADRRARTVEIPEIQIVEGKTSARLGTALVRPLVQAEIVEVVEIGAPLPAESASPIFSSSSRRFRRLQRLHSCSTSAGCTGSTGAGCGEDNRDFTGLEIVENIVVLPEIQAVQTSESLFSFTAPVRRLTPAEIVEVCRDRSSSARRIRVNHVRHGTRLKSSASCCGACRPSCYPFPSRTSCWRSFMC